MKGEVAGDAAGTALASVFGKSETAQVDLADIANGYKIHLLADTEVIYVLTTGGPNAGSVPEPGRKAAITR